VCGAQICIECSVQLHLYIGRLNYIIDSAGPKGSAGTYMYKVDVYIRYIK